LKKLLFLLAFIFTFIPFVVATPQVAKADVDFTVSNMDFSSATGEFSFDYAGTGGATLTQVTLRLPLDASVFNYDVNSFTCTASHCSGTYTGNKSNFTCSGTDYRVLSHTNGTQYNSLPLTAAEFSSDCSGGTPPPVPTPPPGQIVFQDDFTDVNGTLLRVHNSNWNYIDSAEPVIQDNKLFTQNNYARFSLPNTQGNQCASFDFLYPLTGRTEMWMMAKDTPTPFTQGGYYFLLDNPDGHQNFAMSDPIGRLANFDFPVLSTGWHRFEACVVDQYLTAYIDNAQIANAQARVDLVEGYPRIGYSQGKYIDNFVYKAVGVVPNQTPVINTLADAALNEGDIYTASGSFIDPDSTSWEARVDYGDGSGIQPLVLNPDNTFTLNHLYQDNGNYSVLVEIADNQGAVGTITLQVTVENVAPTVNTVNVSPNPVVVNNVATATSSFVDPGVFDTHTVSWDWGDGSNVSESATAGAISASHIYTATGVYEITLTVTDNDGGTSSVLYQYVSVYVPTSSGLFSGARFFNNPAGAFPNTSGQVKFGISMKYDNFSQPTGNASMMFNNADIDFNATSFTYFVTSGDKAYIKGTGDLNGIPGYTFFVSGIDGQSTSGQDLIRFQIKLGSTTIYDSQPNDSELANPLTPLTGNVIVH
jgi:PKD repeat protein